MRSMRNRIVHADAKTVAAAPASRAVPRFFEGYRRTNRACVAVKRRFDAGDSFVWLCLLMGLACLSAMGTAVAAESGAVEMQDGSRHEGSVRLDGGRLVVKRKDGNEVKLDLAGARQVVFRPNAEGQARETKAAPGQTTAHKPEAKPLRGLRAEYFAGYDLKDLRLVRIDPKLETWWPLEGTPDPAVPKEFSARWTGQIEAKYSETYTFQAGFDSGGRLWIDNRLLLDHWKESGTFGTKIDLKAGRKYDIKMEFRKGQWGGNVRLYWSSAHQGQEAVPSSAFTPPTGTVPPVVAISSPVAGEVKLTTRPVVLEAAASDADGQVRKVEFFADGVLVGMAEQAPWRAEWKNPTRGYHKLTAKATDDAGISVVSEAMALAVAGNADGSLPSPWLEMPVGKMEPLGATGWSNAACTLTTTRGDLWGEQDSFHFVFQTLNGDGAISARLVSLQPGKADGVGAGLVIRESLGAERAKIAFLGATSDSGLLFSRRENLWDDRKGTPDEGTPPCFLKLARHGNRVSAYRSEDGAKWMLMGQRNIELPQQVFIGLAIVSSEGEGAKAVFDRIVTEVGSPTMASTVKGLTLRGGTVIAGNIASVDDTSVKMWSAYGQIVMPTSLVARILLRPLTREAIEKLQPGRTGAILNSGDFCDGSVEFKDGMVRVNSVLFGMRKFNAWDETVAAILRDVEMLACRYEIRCRDGSVFRVKAVSIENGTLRVTDVSGASFTIPGAELNSIRRGD